MKEFVKVIGVRNVNNKIINEIDEGIKYVRIDSIDMFKFVFVVYKGLRHPATEIYCPHGTFITLENEFFREVADGR